MISRILIVGAGVIARNHAEAARLLPGKPSVSAADPDPGARASFARQFPEARLFGDADAMLAEKAEGEELVVVATPPWLHRHYTLAGFAGGRHVLCEKPLGMNAAEADELLQAARSRGLHLGCCSGRYLGRPILRRAREIILSGALGTPLHVRWQARLPAARPGIEYQPGSRWFLDRSKAGGGCLLDWGPYDVLTWNAVFDPVAVVVESAWIAPVERGPAVPAGCVCDVEHHACATLQLVRADGTRVRLDYERAAHCFGGRTEVYQVEGPRGAVSWDWLDWQGDQLRHFADHDGADATTIEIVADDPDDPAILRPVRRFVDLLEGRPSEAIADGQAWFNFRILCAMYEVAASGQPQTVMKPR